MRKQIPLFIFVLLAGSMSAQITKSAFFVGNSYTATNNLPQLISDVAESAGDVLLYNSNAPGGYTFEMHTTNTTTLEQIALGTWDYVVLQEQSQLPSFPIDQVEVDCFPFATTLDSLIRVANTCTETMFFMTWGRKDGDASNCAFWPPVCTYNGMDSLLRERYMTMGEDNDAEVSPVGAVWHYLRDTHPEIELYIGDGSHPSAAGSYAAACTFYAAIFRNDPTLITYDFTLPADQAHIIREATKLVVYDSLASWYIGTYIHEPIANFNVNTGIPFTASFENLSENAISYLWNFGDGTNSTEAAPVHIYGAEGMYIVSLEVTGCSDVDDYTSDITITGVETSIQNNAIINWQPENPVHAELFLPANNSNWRIEILDMAGNVVMQTYAQTLITVDGIHAGAYIIYLQQGDERMYRKLMIQ